MRTLPLESPEVEATTLRAWETHIGSRVGQPEALRARLAEGSLPGAFADTASRRSGQPALHIGDRTITHGELDHLAARAASGIDRLGASPGQTLMLIADVGLEEIAAYLGALRVGVAVLLANPTLTIPELEGLVVQSGARWAVGSGEALARCNHIRRGDLQELVGLKEGDGPAASVQLESVGVGELPVRDLNSGSPAILAFTSGTTGEPKPTPLSHTNLLSSVRGAMWAWRWSEEDHLVHALPISHQHGLSGLHATLLSGGRATLLGHLDGERLLETVKSGLATIQFGVPTLYQRLLDQLGGRARGLSTLRLAICGSGPLPIDLARRYEESVGDGLLERYGTTESGLDVSTPHDGPRIAGHVGLPLPGIEVALLDEAGELARRGEPGQILIRGPQVFGGYLGITRRDQPFESGWFATGDIGVFDPSTGYLAIVGRTKEVIITGGMNVYPREVEDVIRAVAAVSDVAVVGVPSARWGEEVVAVVSPSDVDPDEIMAVVSERLAPYKRPKLIHRIDEVPRSPIGKLDQPALRKLIPAGDINEP